MTATRGTVYLLCGLAFSGKTTLALALRSRLGCPVISLDEITAERGLHLGDGLPTEEAAASHREALARAEGLIEAGAGRLVVDDTSCFRFLRDDWRELASRHGLELRLIVLDTPEPEVRRRMAVNRKRPTRRAVDPEVFDRHATSFEWPGPDEPHLTVPAGAHPSTWVRAKL